jgi:hypothetical protein
MQKKEFPLLKKKENQIGIELFLKKYYARIIFFYIFGFLVFNTLFKNILYVKK